MTTEHKYAAVLRAMAEGAVIEEQFPLFINAEWKKTDTPQFGNNNCLLRIAPIQPADADGWRRWYGGENPAPGKRVDYKLQHSDERFRVSSEMLNWSNTTSITHWRESAEQPKPLPDLPPQEPGFGPWVRWEGGENPCGDKTVAYQMRDSKFIHHSDSANDLRWDCDAEDRGSNIIAYCVKLRVRRWRWMYVTDISENMKITELFTESEAKEFESAHSVRTLGPRLDWTLEESDE